MIRGTGFLIAAVCATIAPAAAQDVRLELRPRMGDTLRMRLDQQTEIVGVRGGGRPLSMNTSVSMYTRAIVLAADARGAMILAVTDSVAVRSNDERTRALVEQARRGLEHREVKLRLGPDGTVAIAEEEHTVARDVRDMIAIMPGSFPRTAIAVGDTWMRTMPIPGSAATGVPDGGRVRARFRLDSISRAGDLAWVSMRGIFEAADSADAQDAAAGAVSGTIVVDRKRGWLSESRFLIQMRSTVPAPTGAGAPLRFRTKITQHMRVLGAPRP